MGGGRGTWPLSGRANRSHVCSGPPGTMVAIEQGLQACLDDVGLVGFECGSLGAAGARTGGSQKPDPAPKGVAVLRSHVGMIALDVDRDGRYTVTNILTQERKTLPGGHKWSLEFDEDHFGTLVSPTQPDMPVESIMTYEVFDSKEHGPVIVLAQDDTSQKVFLHALAAKYTDIIVVLSIGAARTKKEIDAVWLSWFRRPAARVMISTRSLYQVLGLTQFGGESWRWVHGSLSRWSSELTKLGYPQHVLRSAATKVLLLSRGLPGAPSDIPRTRGSGFSSIDLSAGDPLAL